MTNNLPEPDDAPWLNLTPQEVEELRYNKQELTSYGREKIRALMLKSQMTERAEKIVNATLELTLRPQSEDRKKVVACVIREVADRLCTDLGELQCPIEVLRDIADEVEAL
jgi:hypothetical protein